MKTYPLSQTQMGIYVTCMNTQEEGNYNIDMLYKLDDDVDIERLAQALDKVIEAHPYVKSRLMTDENGEVMFEDHSGDEFHTSCLEINDIEDVRAHLGEDYNLMQDQLFRLEIYKTQNGNYLYVDFHHIIFDGMSFGVFRADVTKAYAGEEVESEPMNGFQIAEEEVEVRKSEVYQEAKDWYAKEFGAAAEVDSMPLADVYENKTEHFVTVWKQLNIDKAAIDALCEKTGVKESMVFTAGFGYTLSKYTGDDEALYTSIFHGRLNKATRRALCMMVKTLPVYHNFKDTPTVASLLQATSAQTLGSRKRACYSFGELNGDLGIQSEICFVYQGSITNYNLFLDGKEQVGEDLRRHRAGIKLNVQIITKDGGYFAKVEYPSNKFSAEFIDTLNRTYDKVLNEMLVKETLAEIELCDEEEIAKLDSFNAKAYVNENDNDDDTLRYDDDETVLSFFQKAAKQYPDNIAAIFKDTQYTYRELDELTDKIGALIYNKVKDSGKQEPVVSILIPRNEYMFILPLSVMKAGCAYQPLDPSYPQDRLNFMVKDADAALLIADTELRPIINEYEGETLLTSELTEDTLNTLTPSHPNTLTPQSLFILLYTSGSTGVPKGVMLEHQNLVAFIKWYRRYYDLKPEHNVAAYASFGFDANMMDMYPALTAGATLHVVAEELRLDLVALNEYFEKNHITHSFITTQVGVQFLQNTDNHSLKHLSVGGEKLVSVDPAENYTFHNAYGPTECTIFTTALPVLKKEPNIPIGKPTDELECYVMDKQLHRLPVGAAGELVIVGKQVGRGYLNRPDKTAEAFFTYNGKRAYHSGDIVRYREDGNIEFVGRKDGQVKIRGFRIELKEVEAVIRDFPGIENVTVQAFDLESGGKFIAAYIVSDEQIDIQKLNDFILSQKPPYMVPTVTMQIEKIPLNVNQKVDKKALPKPEVKNDNNNDTCAPRELNVLEQQIVELVSQLIGNTPDLGTPLPYCGLSSILSMRLAAQLHKKFGINMTSKELLDDATVITIENAILNHLLSGGEVKTDGSKKSTSTQALLSFAQQGVYAECVANPDTTLYNIPSEVTFPASTDVSVLKNAVERVIESHPMLHARFVENEDNDILQVIPEKYSVKVDTKEIGNQTLDEIKADFLRPFNLAEGPLYRVLIVCGEKHVTLLLDTHHLASDGTSVDIIINQIVNAINGAEVEKESYTFMDFCESQKRFAKSEAFTEHKNFFAEQLANFEAVTDIVPDVTGKEKGVQAEVAAPLPVCDIANTISGITDTHFWLAATAYTLGKYTNSKDVYLTAISSGRQNIDIMDTVGMFVNTLPVSAHISEQSVADYIREVGGMFRATIDHENYPFAQIAADYGYTAGITFGYQLGVIADRKVNGESITMNTFGLDVPKFRIGIFIRMQDGKPSVVLQYDDSLYSAALMQQLADSIVCAAANMLKDIDAPINKVGIIDESTAAAILQAGKGEELDYDRSDTAVSLFRKQAAATPDALCVVFDDPKTGERRSYTYHEVDELTDRMARYLTTQGVGPEQPVGVMIDRSEKIVLFPLSIMKAGGAYMPLDSHFPEDRLSFMCEDAGVKVILTEGELLKDAMPSFTGTVLTYEEVIVGADAELTAPKPENMHVILYTSGSTGKPKGVVLEQHNMANFCHWFTKNFNVTAEDRVAAFANFGFDVHQADLWPILSVGGSIYVIPQDMRLDLPGLEEYINKNNLTLANITTQIGSMFAASVKQSTLRHLIVAGEKLGPTAKPDYGFNNAYGPTECTIYATNYPIEEDYDSSLIGRALTNYSVAVVDDQLNLLPMGVPGELVIMGEGVGRGYLNRPDVTAEKFITYNGQKAYRTGDQVRMMPDGQIDYMGRMDGQVKLRGLRIELGEVEAAIMRHTAVKAAAAAVKDNGGAQHLCAYYVLKDGENASADEIKDFMSKSVTDFMVPDFLTQLDRLPYNANGKVDRKQLPMPAVQEEETASDNSASGHVWNKLQSEIRELIVGTLGIDEIGINTPLRIYGLTSLIAMKLASQLHKRFGIKIPSKNLSGSNVLEIEELLLQYFMQAGTAAIASDASGSPAGVSQSDIATITEAPLTFSQQGVYMDCQMNPDTTMYNIPVMLTFPATVGTDTLQDAVKKVAQMHPALFCNFFQTPQGVVMRKPSELSLDVMVKSLSNEELEVEKAAFVRPFDLENDCLIRTEIVTMSDESKVLMVDMHHLVSDGGSLDIFVNQLVAVLNGQDIAPESYDYLRFAAEQNAKAENGGLKEDKAFFDEMFAEYEAAASVPVNKTSTEEGVPRQTSTPIPADIMNTQLPDGVSKAHFWFAVFNYALSRFANTKDVYTAFISNGRQNLDITDTVGMFVNTLPCAVHIKEQTVEEFVNEVSKTFSDVLDHENYPFARIAADYDFKGSASFAYQLGIKSDYVVNGSVVKETGLSLNKAKIALSIYIQYVNGVPSVMAEYDDSQYTNDLILHFTESMVAVAEHFMADLTAKVKNVSIMSERQRLEVEGMHSVNEDMSFPIRTFHEGIEQWAVKTPDALALMACDRDMTYREYNAEANQMARALMARGMKYGDRVVLLLPRRSYYLTALFAVMKCGGAFIPMDPEYPADRIAYILDDSEGRFVLTTPEKVADYPDRAIDIFQLMEEAKSQPSDNLDVKVDPHDLAYLIYTSGSTGRPKGVMIEHLGAASFLTFYKSDTNFGADSNANRVGLCQSTVSFDLSVGEIGVQVFNGDTVAFANEDEMMSPVEMIKLCRRTGAQTISGTPSRLAVNLELGEYYDLIKEQMKCVVTGGEKLPGALLDELEKMDVYIINTYGPTETTMGSSAGVLNGTREVHVGKPFTNYTYQVLDSDRNELPVGVMGELCIGGIGLARGYNNMPERTAETFIQWQGKRIYRTGDYAMWTKDGNIIIMGRTDNQVKLNGLRIELGEIETVMSQQPGMRQCVAIIKKLGNIDKLIGYYTVDESVANIPVAEYEEQVRADMSVKLTPYMVPGIFVRLDEMPLTPVGKTDVKRLPMPDLQTGEYVAPKNDVEKTFCEIFAKILNLKRISATDNFFELGGTSLVAMQLIGEASKVGYNIVYKTIFDNATPHLLARMLKPELYQGEDTNTKLPLADEIEAYDYAQLDDILAANTLDNFCANKCYEQMGNVLLAGATGFLGIHVLHNLIERNDVPHIYCLVRSNKTLAADGRLRTLLYYYFNNAYEELFANGRITVIEGDVTNAEVFEQFDQPLDMVINCAANVKHFSAGTDIEDINIKGCQNCIDLCLRTGARFIQTSTGSIAGNSVGDMDSTGSPTTAVAPIIFTERDLYHNQELSTKYAASKFIAERNVLDAVKNKGLKGKIMRLGNLSARSTDGEFQINFRSNNAMATLKAYQVLGCIPYEREFGYSEFSPINEVADAIIRLSMTPDCCTVFQPGNVHWPPYGDIIECMNHIGIPIERVEQDEFQKRLAEAMNDAEKSDLVQSLVAYRQASDGRVHVMNGWDTKAYTGQILLRLGFRWSFTTWDYVERYLRCLQGLGVFDNDFKR